MVGRIKNSDIEALKATVNLLDVIRDYVSLKPGGNGSYVGLCPFHGEKTPSFYVRNAVGRYHCFGCGEGGDVYSFIMNIEHLSFVEAVERIAHKVNYTLSYEHDSRSTEEIVAVKNKVRLFELNAKAAEYFQTMLHQDSAETAHTFLQQKGFGPDICRHFGVGFAPNGWDNVIQHLRSEGFTADEMQQAGIVTSNGEKIYDRFRGRVIWPIYDITGNVIAFGARKLEESDTGPKYLNTPETVLYKKNDVLYGLSLAKKSIFDTSQAIVVEGYTDVMACHAAGLTQAVATCGTAFGSGHVRVLRRVLGDGAADIKARSVIFTFDADDAGLKAAARAFGHEEHFAAQTYVAYDQHGLDPCDIRVQRGDKALYGLLEGKQPLFEFMIRRTLKRFDLESIEGRIAAIDACASIVASIRDLATQQAYVRELSRLTGEDDLAFIRRAIQKAKQQHGAVSRSQQRNPVLPTRSHDPIMRVEYEVLMCMLQYPKLLDPQRIKYLSKIVFQRPFHTSLARLICQRAENMPEGNWAEDILSHCPDESQQYVNQMFVGELPFLGSDPTSYVHSVIDRVIDRDLLRKKQDLTQQLMRTSPEEQELRLSLQQRMTHLDQERLQFRQEE